MDDDAHLDAYVEQLIAGVSDCSQSDDSSPSAKDEASNFSASSAAEPVRGKRRRKKRRKRSQEGNSQVVGVNESSDYTSATAKEIITNEITEENKDVRKQNDEDSEMSRPSLVDDDIRASSKAETDDIGQKGKNAQEHHEERAPEKKENGISLEDTAAEAGANKNGRPSAADFSQRSMRPLQQCPPPNTLQRFLLSQGYFGRALAASTILISEMVHRYLPEVHRIVLSFIPEHSGSGRGSSSKKRGLKSRGVHLEYAAVATAGQSVGGKKVSKEQKKEMDRVAMDKLKHVKGGVKSGKYAHLSTAFMTKYNLGKYAAEAKIFEDIISPLEDDEKIVDEEATAKAELMDKDDETEEEEDWVVQALGGDKWKADQEDEDDYFDSDTSNTSEKKRTESMLEAARQSKSSASIRKDVRVKGSDKDGGGGVLGRLRAAGANSGVSTRILGAYPNDAAPIEEAASAIGVAELAEKYGYGEWSDTDEDLYENEDWDDPFQKPRSSRKRKRRKRKKHSDPFGEKEQSPGPSGGLSFSFDVGYTSSSASVRTKRPRSRPAHSSSRRSSANSAGSNISRNRRIEPRRSSQQILGKISNDTRVRRPMERIIEKNNGNKRVHRDELRRQLGLNSRTKATSGVQPPMKRLADLQKKKKEQKENL